MGWHRDDHLFILGCWDLEKDFSTLLPQKHAWPKEKVLLIDEEVSTQRYPKQFSIKKGKKKAVFSNMA